MSDEMDNYIFETYNNYIMPHGNNMFKTAYDMDMTTICAYPS